MSFPVCVRVFGRAQQSMLCSCFFQRKKSYGLLLLLLYEQWRPRVWVYVLFFFQRSGAQTAMGVSEG
jgi:hypothetical protein